MSSLPEIIKTVARRMYKKSQKLIVKQPNQITLQAIFPQSQFDESIDPILSQDFRQPSQNMKTQVKEELVEHETFSKKSQDYEEIRSYFIKTQKRKLKHQYPSFQQEQIEHIAKEVWDKLSEYQISIYQKKVSKFSQEDLESYQQDLSDTNENQRIFDRKRQKNIQSQSIPINESSGKEQLLQMESPDDESNMQGSVTEQPSDIQGRSNEETKASTILCDYSQNIRLPQIDQVAESQRSFVSDQNQDQRVKQDPQGENELQRVHVNETQFLQDESKMKIVNEQKNRSNDQ